MKSFVLIPFLFFFQQAVAATEETSVRTEPQTFSYENQSTLHREGKKYSFTAEPIGLGPSGVIGQGINFGFILDEKSLVSMELHGGRQSTSAGFLFATDRSEVKGLSFGVHYKRYVANSFYIKGGIDQRRTEKIYTYDNFYLEDTTRSFTGESTAGTFAIGNQWQWDTFTLGCDWAGITVPFASRITQDSMSGKLYGYERRDQDDDQRRYVTGPTMTAVRLYLGATF